MLQGEHSAILLTFISYHVSYSSSFCLFLSGRLHIWSLHARKSTFTANVYQATNESPFACVSLPNLWYPVITQQWTTNDSPAIRIACGQLVARRCMLSRLCMRNGIDENVTTSKDSRKYNLQ